MPLHDLQDAIELLENQEPAKAAVLLERMADEMPVYTTARVLLARAYEALGQWDRALGMWREALHLIPNSPVIHRGLERASAKAAPVRHRSRPPQQDPTGTPSPDEPAEPATAEPSTAEPSTDEPATVKRLFEGGTPADLPEDPTDTGPGRPHYDDLDRLISELEAARIVPRPDFDNIPSPELDDDIEDVVSETLARIYASQGQYDEAARVYEILAGQHPDEASDYMQKALEMRSRASDG